MAVLTATLSSSGVYAASEAELLSRIRELQEERDRLNAMLDATRLELQKTQAELERMLARLNAVEAELNQTRARLQDAEQVLSQLRSENVHLSQELDFARTATVIFAVFGLAGWIGFLRRLAKRKPPVVAATALTQNTEKAEKPFNYHYEYRFPRGWIQPQTEPKAPAVADFDGEMAVLYHRIKQVFDIAEYVASRARRLETPESEFQIKPTPPPAEKPPSEERVKPVEDLMKKGLVKPGA